MNDKERLEYAKLSRKMIDVTINDLEQQINNEKQITPVAPEIFFPEVGEKYWFFETDGDIFSSESTKVPVDEERISLGVYRTREDCERTLAIQQATVRIKKWAQENVPFEEGQGMWFVKFYNTNSVEFVFDHWMYYKVVSPIGYFSTSDDLSSCIEANKDDFLTVWGVDSGKENK